MRRVKAFLWYTTFPHFHTNFFSFLNVPFFPLLFSQFPLLASDSPVHLILIRLMLRIPSCLIAAQATVGLQLVSPGSEIGGKAFICQQRDTRPWRRGFPWTLNLQGKLLSFPLLRDLKLLVSKKDKNQISQTCWHECQEFY